MTVLPKASPGGPHAVNSLLVVHPWAGETGGGSCRGQGQLHHRAHSTSKESRPSCRGTAICQFRRATALCPFSCVGVPRSAMKLHHIAHFHTFPPRLGYGSARRT